MGQTEALPPNPTISKIQKLGGRSGAPFVGWVGSGAGEGHTRLHLDINALGYHIEFENGDVMHSMDVPESVMPFGAKAVWLKADARVRLTRSVRTSATQVSRFLRHAGNVSPNIARAWMLGPNMQNFSGNRQTGPITGGDRL